MFKNIISFTNTRIFRKDDFVIDLNFNPIHETLNIFRGPNHFRLNYSYSICPSILISAKKIRPRKIDTMLQLLFYDQEALDLMDENIKNEKLTFQHS